MKKSIHPKLNKIKVQMTDGSEFETLSTWGSDGEVMKLEIDPKSHPAWTGESQKAQDKGRVSKFNKRFANLKRVKMNLPLMPKATAVWLIENTSLTFKQIADFCGLHELEIKGIADGDVAIGIKAYNPILSNQLTRDEIEASSQDPNRPLKLVEKDVDFEVKKMVGTKYTPISQREDKPNAIAWLTKNYSILTDAQICKLVGSTKNTVDAIRNRKHWNISNITPKDPVMANLCSQTELQAAIDKAKRRQEREIKKKEREAKKAAKAAASNEIQS